MPDGRERCAFEHDRAQRIDERRQREELDEGLNRIGEVLRGEEDTT